MYCTVYIVFYIGAINGNIFILRIPLLTKNFLLPSVDKFYPNKSRDIFFFFFKDTRCDDDIRKPELVATLLSIKTW